MKNQSSQQPTAIDQSSTTGLVPPFNREEFHKAVFLTYLVPVRAIAFLAGSEAAWAAIGKSASSVPDHITLGDYKINIDAMLDAAAPIDDWLGLSYEDIVHTPFANKMEAMYDYAYFGTLDQSKESMEPDSTYNWIGELLCDLSSSAFACELDAHGETDAIESAKRCFRVAETANARVILEGGEPFFHGKDLDTTGYDSLSVRQMALLANMEEMSIRAAANKTQKRANPLTTFSEEGRTRIAPEIAKEWLKSKGRYVSITRKWAAGHIDLTKTRFSTSSDLLWALVSRRRLLDSTYSDSNPEREPSDLDRRLAEIGIDQFSEVEPANLGDAEFIRKIAKVMDLPADLLVLRAKEALLRDQLAYTEHLIRESQNPTPSADAGSNK